MTSKSLTTTVSRRPKLRRDPPSRRRTPPGAEESESLGLDGAGDARWLKRKQKNAMSARQAKRSGASPFDGATSDDNRKQKNNGAFDRKKTATSTQSIVANGRDFKSKKFAAGGGNARPNSTTYEVNEDAYPTSSLLPFATSIYDQLRSDGIYPPKWPISVSNTAAMAKLREDHKVYRERARESLIRANLVDAPGVQKRLEDALVFKGVCENMCPEMEMITRIIEPDIPSVEKEVSTSIPDRHKMIKKLARSAAGQETPLPMDVLSVAAMRRTLNYLFDDLLRSDDNLPAVHGYLWDRTRALRRDFTFHSEMCEQELMDQVYCYENIIRFHVTALHLLSKKDVRPEEFSEQQELEQLSKTLMSLMTTYETCEAKGVVCDNESEFRAYYGLFFASSPDIQSSFQRGARSLKAWKDSDVIRTAISLIEALQNTTSMHGPLGNSPSHAAASFHTTYFRIVEDPSVSYTMACFAEIHFGTLRRAILQQTKKAYRRPKILSKDPTPGLLNSFLRFDTDDEAVEFIEQHGLSFIPHEEAPNDKSRQYLDVTQHMGMPRIRHTFSRSLVEKKRGNRSLPSVIHKTIFEDPSATTDFSALAAGKTSEEESLFVSDNVGFLRHSVSSTTKDDKQHWHASPFAGSNAKTNPSSTTQANTASPFQNALPGSSPGALSTPNNPFSSTLGSANTTFTPKSTTTSPFGQPAKPPPSNGLFGQSAPLDKPSESSAPTFQSPFGQLNGGGAKATATSTSPFGQPQATLPGSASPFGQQKDATPSTSPFAQLPVTNGSKPAPSVSPFSQPAPSDKKPQDPVSSFKSPFSSATPSPFATTAAPASSPFTQATAKPSIPASVESTGVFGTTPPTATLAMNNASPFSNFAPKPSETKQPYESLPTADSAPKLPQPATSSVFAKPSALNLSKAAPIPTAEQPSGPSFNPTGLGTSKTPTLAPPTFTVTPPTPTLPVTTNGASSAAKPALAVAATSTFNSRKEPSLAGKDTNAETLQSTKSHPTESPPPSTTFATTPASSASLPPMASPPLPKKDLLGDFTRWFVEGDGGLLQEFQDYMVENLLRQTFDQFVSDEEERRRKEEEASDLAKARDFQIYNLRVKFFYRWRDIARTLRLRRRRAKDKAEYKAYMAAKRAEEVEAKKQARRRAEAEHAALERSRGVDAVSEFRDLLQSRKDNAGEYEAALLACGILSGVGDEQEAASQIVRGDFAVPRLPERRATSRKSLPNGDSASVSSSVQASVAGGAKTRALREQLHGGSNSSFRRSLPPGSKPSPSWHLSPSPSDSGKRVSKVSDRWRLKAMGLATMPDGTALPEQLANSMRYDGKRYEGWGSFGLDGKNAHHRSRSTSTDMARSTAVRNAFVDSFRKSSGTPNSTTPNEPSPPSTKRKRAAEDEAIKTGIKSKKLATRDDSIERILREARELRGSLRSSRMDLDETTGWFKEQSEMMQHDEMLSRRSSSNWAPE